MAEASAETPAERNSESPPIETLIPGLKYLEQYAVQVLDYTSKYNSRLSRFYAPENLIGKCEIYPSYGDSISTYILRTYGPWWKKSEGFQKEYLPNNVDPLGAEDYVTVLFRSAVFPRDVFIYETYNPGAIVRIWGRLTNTPWNLLWEGKPQVCLQQSRKFAPKIKKINNMIDQIRLDFNQSHLSYYTSIDAILLGGLQPQTTLQYNLLLKRLFPFPQKPKEEIVEQETQVAIPETPSQMDRLSSLPYEVIVHIFQYLDLNSLTKCGQVNQRLHAVSLDPLFYYNLNLKRYWNKVTGKTLYYFMQRCRTLRKLDLSWCGNGDGTMAEAFIALLGQCGETLTHLSLGNCDFINERVLQEIGKSCNELVELRIRNRQLAENWLYLWDSNLTKLVTLELFNCDIKTPVLMNVIRCNPNLQHCIFDFCESLQMDTIIDIATQTCKNLLTWSCWKASSFTIVGALRFSLCRKLRELDLGWCLMVADPGDSLTFIAQNCRDLRRLVLSGWRAVDDTTLLPIIGYCDQLRQLELVGLKSITPELCEMALFTLPHLELLDVSYCHVSEEHLIAWRETYPRVTVQRTYGDNERSPF